MKSQGMLVFGVVVLAAVAVATVLLRNEYTAHAGMSDESVSKVLKSVRDAQYVYEEKEGLCFLAFRNGFNGIGLAGPISCERVAGSLINPPPVEKKQAVLPEGVGKDRNSHVVNLLPNGDKCCAGGLSPVRINVHDGPSSKHGGWYAEVCLEDLKPSTRKHYERDARPLSAAQLKQCNAIKRPPQKKTGSLLRQEDDDKAVQIESRDTWLPRNDVGLPPVKISCTGHLCG